MQSVQAIPATETARSVEREIEAAFESPAAVPLVVDLDGTLIRSNLLWESVALLLKRSILYALLLPVWLLQGRAKLKKEVCSRVKIDYASLPLNQPLIDHLRREKARGRNIYLATGAHESLAREIAARLGLFEDVIASDGTRNLTGRNKLEVLRERFGATGFDYAGNERADYPIWRAARQATVVNATGRVVRWASTNARVQEVFPRTAPTLATYMRAMRLHQWLKNFLLFAPLVAALHFTDTAAIVRLTIGFLAFGLCASSVYLLNDIVDIEDDRRHPRKRARPFASGELPIEHGFVIIPLLLAGAGMLTLLLPWQFGAVIAAYYATTLAYTFVLKRQEALDVVTLALLYTTRIFAGGAAAGIPLSIWLLTFSTFIFLSLALAKRSAELFLLRSRGEEATSARGYRVADLPILQSMGIGSGYVAVVVLALYLNSGQVERAYTRPELLWTFVPVLIYWVTRIWLKTCRGEMHDDPVVFAARDRASLALGALCGVMIWMAM